MRYILKVTQFLKLMAIKDIQTLLKACSKAIKEGATVKDVIKYTLKFTVGAVLGATVDQVPLSKLKCDITKTTHLRPIHLFCCLSWIRLGQEKAVQ